MTTQAIMEIGGIETNPVFAAPSGQFRDTIALFFFMALTAPVAGCVWIAATRLADPKRQSSSFVNAALGKSAMSALFVPLLIAWAKSLAAAFNYLEIRGLFDLGLALQGLINVLAGISQPMSFLVQGMAIMALGAILASISATFLIRTAITEI
jgi:hypothetical protein